jgi:hypothetical protein
MERHQVKGLRTQFALAFFLMLPSCASPEYADLCENVLWSKEQSKTDKADKIVTIETTTDKVARANFTGIITDLEGNQLSGAFVQMTYPGLNGQSPTDTTNVAGRFTFSARRLPSSVSLRVDKAGYRCLLGADIPVTKGAELQIRLKTIE